MERGRDKEKRMQRRKREIEKKVEGIEKEKSMQRRMRERVCRLHTAFLHWPLSSAATKKV